MTRNIVIVLLFISCCLTGQKTEFETYSWNTIPEADVQDTVKPVGGVKYTLERRINEVYLNKENYFEEIVIIHRRIKVESHDAINNYNKIYVPINDVIEIMNIKARFISKDGKITELPKESIKELENLEDRGNFKIFAIEGAEIGGEIEYFYTLRSKFDAYKTVYVQDDIPKTNVEVIYSFPSQIEYLIKSYNGFPEFISSTDSAGTTYMKVKTDYIPALSDERFSHYKANLMRYESTLAYNRYNSSLRTYSWSKISNNVYKNIYVLTKSERAAVLKVIKTLALNELATEQKIRLIENWIKNEIAMSDAISQSQSLEQIIKLKQTSKFGITRLFVALLNESKIPFELVMTCKNSERNFDPEFNGWNFLDDYLIYFKEFQQYIVPDDPSLRFGLMSISYQDAYGLFMHPVHYNEKLGSLAHEIRKLPVAHYTESFDSLSIKVNFDFSRLNTMVDIHRVMSGNLAAGLQPYWESANEERHLRIIEDVFDMGDKNTEVQSYTVLNGSPSDIGLNPLIMDVKLTARSLIETAGNDFIVNIGRTIGTQSELYQDTERKLPINIDFAHGFYRKIAVAIPDGYSITNLDDLTMKVEMVSDGKVSACFTSWYTLDAGTLYIYSSELYPEIAYPKSRFNEFRDVINAAADFNKKTLIFTPGK